MSTPGERAAARVKAHFDHLHFYVDSLTNIERSRLAARFLRRFSRKDQLYLVRRLTVAEMAFGEVFNTENHGWWF